MGNGQPLTAAPPSGANAINIGVAAPPFRPSRRVGPGVSTSESMPASRCVGGKRNKHPVFPSTHGLQAVGARKDRVGVVRRHHAAQKKKIAHQKAGQCEAK